jgi:excinuclease ABC subunit C
MKAQDLYKNIPPSPGVYIMKNARGEILYIGKAANLYRRVSSYFLRPHDARIEKLVSEIKKISFQETDSALEALVLEAKLIKQEQPPYNIREKDDKSFLFIEITKEDFPRVLLVRGKNPHQGKRFGPFVSSSDAREALHILRKIFPWSTHLPDQIGKQKRPCFDYQIGLCPGTCIGVITKKDYAENIKNLLLFLSGKKKNLLKNLEKKMHQASEMLAFERAKKYRGQIFALNHIQDSLLIKKDEYREENVQNDFRIEGYDISNISGTDAVGSLVVFSNTMPRKSEYKKFIIKTIQGQNDTAMLREVLLRRFKNNWPLPNLIFVDGGKPQVSAVLRALDESGLAIPVVGIAKGPTRKKVEFIGAIPQGILEETLIHVRDEAHRFAISFHRARRSGRMRGK